MRTLPLIFLSLIALSADPAMAQVSTAVQGTQETEASAAPRSSAIRENRPGWFFYKDPKEEPKKKPLPKPPPATSSTPSKPADRVGSAAWLAENLPKLLERSIDEPTSANIELYAFAQKLAMDKSEVFATKYIRVMAGNPALDETISNPTAGFALREQNTQADGVRAEVLQEIASKTGMWYFFRSDCPYCRKQNPVLEILARESGISILPISLDHRPLEDGTFPEWQLDAGQGAMLGVTSTPTLYLVHPQTKQVVNLAVGQRSLPDIERRIVEIARDRNWITEDRYQLAMRGLPHKYLTEAFDPSTIKNPDDPNEVLEALRAAAVHGSRQSATFDELTNAPLEENASPWTAQE